MHTCIHKEVEKLRVPQLSAEVLFVHDGTNSAINYRCFICLPDSCVRHICAKESACTGTWSVRTVTVLALKQSYCLHNTGRFPISCNALLDFLN